MAVPGQQKYDPQTYRSGTRKGINGAVFSSNLPHRAPLLCYIAGIECPIVQASVSYGVWKIPEAQVALFPDPSLQRFGAEDRVNIVIFYLDEYVDPKQPTWRMLFEGEIVGWGYTNTAAGRSLQLNAVADISIFTQLFFFYMTTLSTVASGVLSISQTAEQINQPAAVFPYALFRKGLVTSEGGPGTGSGTTQAKVQKEGALGTSETTTFNTNYITRPFDFAYNVVIALIDSTIPAKQRCVPAVNFFSRWVRRTQFHNKWVALPFLDEVYTSSDGKTPPTKMDNQPSGIFPVLRAVQSQKAVECLQNYVAAQNANAAIFTLLKQVLDTVFMEICMLPTPAAVECQTDGAIVGAPSADTTALLATQLAIDEQTATTIQQMQQNLVIQTDAAAIIAEYTQPIRLAQLDEADEVVLRQALQDVGQGLSANEDITAAYMRKADAAAAANVKSMQQMITQVQGSKGPKNPKQPLRLTNYFIKPQFLFGLPPVCNVIFPSMTPQIQYSENYITQPTRLYIQDEALGSIAPLATNDPTLKQTVLTALARAYPPEADRKFQEHLKAKNYETGKNMLVFPEEFFKGPVTSRFTAPPWLMYFAAENQVGSKTGGEQTPKTVVPDSGTTLTDADVYKLYAQYEYFRQRFEQRNGAVMCAFQPYVLPGFPCMIFDDFQSSLHLVGYLMNATHMFTSRSVETSLNYSYARTIYEFFQDIYNEIWYPTDKNRKGLACAAAPPEPIPEIRDIIQHFDRADQFYQALFYRRPTVKANRPAVFQYRDILAFVQPDGTLKDIVIEGLNEETIKRKKPEAEDALKTLQNIKEDASIHTRAALQESRKTIHFSTEEWTKLTKALDLATNNDPTAYGGYETMLMGLGGLDLAILQLESKIYEYNNPGSVLKSNIGSQQELAPKPGYEAYFDSYDAAMSYCARPICTLEEYIEFIGGVREGINDDMSYKTGGSISSARYYTRIRRLTGATDATIKTLTLEQQGLGGEKNAPLPDNFPDMRLAWDKAMLAYRERIYSIVKAQR